MTETSKQGAGSGNVQHGDRLSPRHRQGDVVSAALPQDNVLPAWMQVGETTGNAIREGSIGDVRS